jgi:hypothetical protein
MKLTAKTDLEAPVEFVHAFLCDVASWEREVIRRGIEIERPADMPLTGVGAGWRIRVPFRGRVRKVLLRLDDLVQDQTIAYSFEGQAMLGSSVLETKALSPRRSRLRVTIEAKPKTLAARLFLNTLRLARRRVEDRLERRVGQLGDRIAERYARERV